MLFLELKFGQDMMVNVSEGVMGLLRTTSDPDSVAPAPFWSTGPALTQSEECQLMNHCQHFLQHPGGLPFSKVLTQVDAA